MIHFNIDHQLGFKGHYYRGERTHFFSLAHYLLCEKFFSYDENYYAHLCKIRCLDTLKAETTQYSNDTIEAKYLKYKTRIILTGLHFSITQNDIYFMGFCDNDEEVYSEDCDFNELIKNYKKRYHIATNTERLFLYSDASFSGKECLLNDFLQKMLSDSHPEEIILEEDSNLSTCLNDLLHSEYLPLNYIQDRRDLPLRGDTKAVYFENDAILSKDPVNQTSNIMVVRL